MQIREEAKIGEAEKRLPSHFRVKSQALLSPRLTLYDVTDRRQSTRSRIWLENFSNWPEQHWQRAEKLKKLAHPNLLKVTDHWLTSDGHYYAMRVAISDSGYIPLRTLIAGRMRPGLVGQIIRQVGLAVQYYHSAGMVYLVLQPNFIWLGGAGSVQLEPFAARLESLTCLSQTGGTELKEPTLNLTPYFSPEQFKTKATPGKPADIYSLGLLAYELLSGFNPFWADTNEAIQEQIEHKTLKPLTEINPGVSSRLAATIQRAMSRQPAERFGSALDFLAEFEAGLLTSAAGVNSDWVGELLADYQKVSLEAHTFSTSPAQKVLPTPISGDNGSFPLANQPTIIPATLILPTLTPKATLPTATRFVTRRRSGWLHWPTVAPWLLVLNVVLMLVLLWSVYNTSPEPLGTSTVITDQPRPDPAGTAIITPDTPPVNEKLPPSNPIITTVEEATPSPTVAEAVPDRWQERLKEAHDTAFKSGDFEKAIQIYESILVRDDHSASVYRELGKTLYWQSHDTGSMTALDALKRAVALDPKDAGAWAYLALAYHELYQYDKGLSAALQAARLNGRLVEALAAQALLVARADDQGQANLLINEALSIEPDNLLVKWVWSALLRRESNWPKAGQVLDELINQYPLLAILKSSKADLLRSMGPDNYAEALNWYGQAIKLDTQLPYAFAGQAAIDYQKGQYTEAEAAYKHALELRPTHAHSLTGLGYLKLVQKKYPEAVENFKQAVKIDPRESEAYNGLAITYLNQAEYSQVKDWAELAIKYAPRYPDPYFNEGRAFYEMKNYKEAVRLFSEAILLEPANPRYQEGLAFASYYNGDKEAARKAAQESLRLNPANPTLTELLKQLN